LEIPSHVALIATVSVTTLVWLAVTYLTAPTDRRTLVKFSQLVRPAGPGWNPIQAEAGVGPSPDSLTLSLLGWTAGCAFVFSALFGSGSWLYGRQGPATMWLLVFIASALVLLWVLRRMWPQRASVRTK
jgi:hypothetical protein